MTQMHNPPHPGLVLQEYIEGHPVATVADHIGVSRNALYRVLGGKAAISPEMSIKLGEALGTGLDFWLRMQTSYDFWQASQAKRKPIKKLEAA